MRGESPPPSRMRMRDDVAVAAGDRVLEQSSFLHGVRLIRRSGFHARSSRALRHEGICILVAFCILVSCIEKTRKSGRRNVNIYRLTRAITCRRQRWSTRSTCHAVAGSRWKRGHQEIPCRCGRTDMVVLRAATGRLTTLRVPLQTSCGSSRRRGAFSRRRKGGLIAVFGEVIHISTTIRFG